MKVHCAPFARIFLLVGCALLPKDATAQYSTYQCTSVLNALTQATREKSFKKMITLERENLTFCKAHMQGHEYVDHLEGLAHALNGDHQYEQTIGVTNNCLRDDAHDLPCLLEKADALYHLGRVPEAKSIIAISQPLDATTELDLLAKQQLQQLQELLAITPPGAAVVPSPSPNQIIPFSRAVPLKKYGGAFVLPVRINDVITLDFALDSGATDVTVPADVFSTLRRTGTIKDNDINGDQTYVLADGSRTKSVTFTIRSLRVGDKLVENVRASVAPSQGSLLLGQSFLERFKSWSIDNAKNELLLESK
jgi:clan AA aspartic protease (TIGR02281 family)